MGEIKEFIFMGHYHFDSKDKTKHYYVLQLLANQKENETINRATLISVFVEKDIFKKALDTLDLGTLVKCEVLTNYSTGKVFYKVVL